MPLVYDESNAQQRICEDLGLPKGDAYTQDWVYELGEEYRSESCLNRYLVAYSNHQYGDAERRVLVKLMLDVVNDLLQENENAGCMAWERLVELIQRNFQLHRDQLEYWAVSDGPMEDAFALTPLARRFLASGGVTSG